MAVARDALDNAARDNGGDEEKFRNDLFNIARTTLSSKLLTQHKDFFAQICVDAIMKIKGGHLFYCTTIVFVTIFVRETADLIFYI